MKKFLLSILCIMCAGMLVVWSASAQEVSVLTVSEETAFAGQTVTVTVSLTGSGYAAYQMELHYDAAQVELLEVTGGPGGTPISNPAEPGRLRVAYAGATEQKADVLFTVDFRVKDTLKAGQSTPVCLQNVRVFAVNGANLALDVRDGSIAGSPSQPTPDVPDTSSVANATSTDGTPSETEGSAAESTSSTALTTTDGTVSGSGSASNSQPNITEPSASAVTTPEETRRVSVGLLIGLILAVAAVVGMVLLRRRHTSKQ